VAVCKADNGFGAFNGGTFFSQKFPAAPGHTPSRVNYPKPTPAPSYPTEPAYSTAPAPAPSYSTSQPSYPAPAPSYQQHSQPQYQQPSHYKQPTHNCTVENEKIYAEVCTPTFVPRCEPVTLKGTKIAEGEKCLSITRTVCAQTTEETTVMLCSIKYESKPSTAQATTIEVGFAKECNTQMVTVCEPQKYPQQHGYSPYRKESYQHCTEIAQETCYNKPQLKPKQEQVDVTLPEAVQECGPQRVMLPTVECEDITEERCVPLPSLEAADVSAEQCSVEAGPPSCNQVELVLPKQVCKELIYGHASKPVHPASPYSI